jgi:prolyl-tRNA editing enzyme YbaK/EbsC (Cys-tRNA(Pro) deacylase)
MTPIEQAVTTHLDALSADYSVMEIDPALADTAAFCEAYGVALEESANAIVVESKRPKGRLALCLNLATTRLDANHRVKGLMEVSKLSFASPEVTKEATGMEIGGVTPFGIPDGMPIYVDAAVMGLASCVVGGGSRRIKIRVDPEVFGRTGGVEVIEGLAFSA